MLEDRTVPAPVISGSKTVNPTSGANPGDTLSYSVTVSNINRPPPRHRRPRRDLLRYPQKRLNKSGLA
jgi:hypothetical protein